MHSTPSFKEDQISQVPALQLLQNLGYTYLTPEKALELRGGRKSAVILEGVLAEQLRKINCIRFKGKAHPFSEGNILSAIETLKDVVYDGLVRTNEKIYDLLCLGRSLQQAIARVNRLYDGKDFGYIIDYRGVLHKISTRHWTSAAGYPSSTRKGSTTSVQR